MKLPVYFSSRLFYERRLPRAPTPLWSQQIQTSRFYTVVLANSFPAGVIHTRLLAWLQQIRCPRIPCPTNFAVNMKVGAD